MQTLESVIRLMVIGQEILIAAVFLFGPGTRAARYSAVFLLACIIGYLFVSDAGFPSVVPSLVPIAALFAIAVPYGVWLFARAIFEAPWPRPIIVRAIVLVVVLAWLIFLGEARIGAAVSGITGVVMRVLSLIIIVHALWIAINGRPDDLLERRRRFRLFFVAAISLQAAAILVVELVLAGDTPPAWLSLTNVLVIATLTMALAVPLLRPNETFFGAGPKGLGNTQRSNPVAAAPEDAVYRDRLFALMDDGVYRETGLTISTLARHMEVPEHRLRRLINGHLGYRNFSAFLNQYRIAEARVRLADAGRARTPVLTIALDLGYASLGPFNRAFKESTGMTPTEFRRHNLGTALADSE